ncbi:hypothetical protein HCN44_006626 [Aphidius gifuensis]|uniref:Uncharacterized protein n=2 Tax=Aphidius gifuensis TaxID=684658 RepID=A0A835CT02_APHGI|nr:hypothetical protein HCN44_006626 [Aphidius gifuensis]
MMMYGDKSHRIEVPCSRNKTINYSRGRVRLETDYNDELIHNGNIIFAYYVPLIFSDLIGHFFIFFHLICSGLLLGGTFMTEKSSLLPWLGLGACCTLLHVGSAIKELTKLPSLICPTNSLLISIIQISIIYILEIYIVILVYSYYKQLDEEIICDESDESVIKNQINKTNDDANMIPEVVTCTVLNQMNYICEPIV